MNLRLASRAGLLSLALILGACQTAAERSARLIGEARLAGADRNLVGTARLFLHGRQISLTIAVEGLPGTEHPVRLVPGQICAHAGDPAPGALWQDLPPLRTGEDGSGTLSVLIERDEAAVLARSLLAGKGNAIQILAAQAAKDGKTSKAQEAIACGVLRPV